MTIEKAKITGDTREELEIIDLRVAPHEAASFFQQNHIYPGWHMNKKSWFTVILDDSLSDERLKTLIDASYHLAGKL